MPIGTICFWKFQFLDMQPPAFMQHILILENALEDVSYETRISYLFGKFIHISIVKMQTKSPPLLHADIKLKIKMDTFLGLF